MINNVEINQLLIQLVPVAIVLGLMIFLTSKVKKRNLETINKLKEQDVEKFKKVKIYNAYLRLIVFGLIGLFWIGGGIYNYLKFPEQTKIIPIFICLLGVGLVGIGFRNFLLNKNVSKKDNEK